MVRHLNFHLSLKQFQCDLCDLSFARSKSLKMHLLRHDSPKAGAFKCSSCEKTFISKKHLKMHKKTHVSPKIQKFIILELWVSRVAYFPSFPYVFDIATVFLNVNVHSSVCNFVGNCNMCVCINTDTYNLLDFTFNEFSIFVM